MATLLILTMNDTGFVSLPQGTTGNRATAAAGMIRYNTTNSTTEYYDGTVWKTIGASIQAASGGTTAGNTAAASRGGFNVHTFTSPGTFTPTYPGTVELLVVAGGGGGSGLSGGGGGGGYIYNGSYSVTGGTGYAVTVGTGGSGATGHTNNTHTPGNPSVFGGPTGVISTGGGRGYSYSGNVGDPGGSGGGGGGGGNGQTFGGVSYPAYGQKKPGDGIIGQGHPGGWGHHHYGAAGGPGSHVYPQPSICVYGGAGGGGAGEMGYNRQGLYYEAKGGDGASSSITGTAVTYYAGGGAGGSHGPADNYARDQAGRSLGGGGGSYSAGPQAYMDATGHGSGGGSAHHPDSYRSGNGSAGIVIVRYRTT
jgi:hypothetical protein